MYQCNFKLTDKQYNLLSEALFFYSEEKNDDNLGNNIEELEDLIDRGSQKVTRKKKTDS
tara:strand:- start:6352 stop:6528 length:177 start_codon:yes stop_codon:yes gene_type:complete